METINKIPIGGRLMVCPDQVVMLQADANYSIVFLADGTQRFVATTLKILENRLKPFQFVRMNRRYLINKNFIVEELENALKLTNQQTIKFSRRKGKVWKEATEQY